MSADIKPGDLVMVVRPTLCCGNGSSIGVVGVAESMLSYESSECHYCGEINKDMAAEVIVGDASYDLPRLKKIDPPALADDTDAARELEVV